MARQPNGFCDTRPRSLLATIQACDLRGEGSRRPAGIARLLEYAVAVRSLTEGNDPSTSSGKMVLGVLATLAEYERDLIRERVNAGIAAARARDHPPRFGRPPLDPVVVAEKLAIAQRP